MSISVILRVKCDGFQPLGKVKKKCARHGEFEDLNVRDAKIAAEDEGWCFGLKAAKDVCFCSECGPRERPYLYRKR